MEPFIGEGFTAITDLQHEQCPTPSFFQTYECHRVHIQQYVEKSFSIYSHWITNELENINHGITASACHPSNIFTTEERKWIDENRLFFHLHCDHALLPSLLSSDKRAVDIDELLTEERSILVSSDPGSGSTTWTYWFMWKYLQMFQTSLQETDRCVIVPLPIMIRINHLVKYFDLNTSASFFDYLCRVCIDDSNEQASAFVSEYLVYGQTVIILDGLDDVDSEIKRDHLIDLLIQFLKLPVLVVNSDEKTTQTKNRLILTSHSILSLPKDCFVMCTLTALSMASVENFIDNWWDKHCLHLKREMVENYSNQWND